MKSFSTQVFSLPRIPSDLSRLPITASGTPLIPHMIRPSTTSSTANMKSFSSTLPKRWSALALSQSFHLGGGEMMTTLSPRTIMTPSFLKFALSVMSSVSSSTKLRCWSKPFNFPRKLFPPFNRTRTTLPRLSSKILVAISLMCLSSRVTHLSACLL